MRQIALVCCLILGIVVTVARAAAQPPEQSISTSRQFIVCGTDLAGRGAICDFAEQTKRELLTLLGQRDAWTAAIIVNAQHSRANLPEVPRLSVGLGQTGFGLKLQFDVVIDSGVSRLEIRRELLRALVLEMVYRAQPNLRAGAIYVSPPDWFLAGVPAQQSNRTRERMTELLALPVRAGSVLTLQKFLAQRPDLLDGPGRTLYRAYAFALVDLLRRSSDGPHRLTQFLLDLPAAGNDQFAELNKHFPGVFEGDGEATWQKQIARLSVSQPSRLLGTRETERQLGEMLRLKICGGDTEKRYGLIEFPDFLKNKAAKKTLSALAHDLTALATRAHPIYAPIIADYAGIAALLVRGKTLDVPRRLERLEKMRKTMGEQMREIDDYLNWFEATRQAQPSGEFAGYMKAAERASQPVRTKRDAISVYLDAVETQFDP